MKKEKTKMIKFLNKMWVKFLTGFGCIKVFKFPLFIVYDPSEYEMNGKHIYDALNMLKPGDIMLRGYNSYLDGYFIDDPLDYSHGAVYVGDSTVIHAVAKGVSEIHVVDFMKCDRICIIRPKNGQEDAIKLAHKFVEDNIPYDFYFKNNCAALYCFELCAKCYPNLDIKRIEFKKFFGLLKRKAYLADSLRKSPDMKIMFEYNPKHSIDFIHADV